jgi:hypothetical protein
LAGKRRQEEQISTPYVSYNCDKLANDKTIPFQHIFPDSPSTYKGIMSYLSLSRNDMNVLGRIKDPGADPTSMVVTDPSLPRDPHITDAPVYERVAGRERKIILGIQQAELQAAGNHSNSTENLLACYQERLSKLDKLIREHPNYASARNNRVQVFRRLYGDGILIEGAAIECLHRDATAEERKEAAATALGDLETSLRLLSPVTPAIPLSPQVTNTLSLAYTQRAAIYHTTAKLAASHRLSAPEGRHEANWSTLDFEEAAARDFAMGAKFGNEIARGLAVSVNPTAKLCGQMVREAIKREYGPAFASRRGEKDGNP